MKFVQLDGNILERIGIAIRLLHKSKGLTQLELSERCGIDRKFISSIERGYRNCSILTLCQITHALDKDLVNFINSISRPHVLKENDHKTQHNTSTATLDNQD